MKRLILLAVLVLLTGCGTIPHKTFRIVKQQQGGVLSTSIDPATMTVTPKVVFGSSFTSITTVPENVKEYECTIKTYSWWTGSIIAEEHFIVKRGKQVIKPKK